MTKPSPLLSFLAGATPCDGLSGDDWSLLVAEARSCGLLGRVANKLLASPMKNVCPPALIEQLHAATIYTSGFRKDVIRELAHIREALRKLQVPVILLKGASYVFLDLPPAVGRTFSDIDILVPREHISRVEAALMLGGWSTGKLNAYDARYYRQWSHEIPPMTHLRRGTTVDLHHSLVMPTCRIKVDSARMTSEAIPVRNEKLDDFWWHLKDADMLLHAASHLLLNSEFDRGLRDIWDIDMLFRHFDSNSSGFPLRLMARAREVGLENIVIQALWLASNFFQTPVPEYLLLAQKDLIKRLLATAASTRHPETRPTGQKAADVALLLREMYLRLPGKLLAVHLLHKATAPFTISRRNLAG